MTSKASMLYRLCGLAISLAITTPALAQTVTAVGDNRSGSVYASDGVGEGVSSSYATTPRSNFAPNHFAQNLNDGGASASLQSDSEWLDLGVGNETYGFVGSGALLVALGANPGSCNASDHAQISLWVQGLVGGQTMSFDFHGWVTNTFSSGSVHLVGPGVNITYGSQAEWNQTLQFQNGVYTLTIDAATSLLGTGPDTGAVNYSVVLRRIPTAPPNDSCDAAITITEGTTPVSIVNATGATAGPESCTGTTVPSILHDVFYRYVATANGVATISTCGTVDWDTQLAAFTGSCAAPVFVACNNDSCGAHAVIDFPTVCGETYTIVLGSYYPDLLGAGTGTMTLTQTGGCFSADACEHAFPVVQGDNNIANWYDWASDIVLPAWCALGGDSTIHRGTFWTWTAPASGQVVISTCGTVADPVDSRLAVFVGSCDSPQWIGCNDNACGVFSTISFYASCGQEYTIAVGSSDGAIGSWNLNISQSGGLCNDQCAGATPVAVGANSVTNIGATGSTITPAGCGGGPAMVIANDVFYTYVANASGTATVSTCGGVNFDSRLGVFTGSCAAPVWVACNDDGDGCHFFSSSLSFETVCGQMYTIVLGNNPDNFGPGSGSLTITQQGSCPDSCEGAAPLSLGANQVSTLGMTGATYLPAECNEGYGVTLYNSAFFTYEATADGIATIATCGAGTDFDTRVAAYAGTCDALELLACNDDGAPCGIAAQLSFPTTCGTRYVIELGSFDGQMGHATLNVSQTGMCGPKCLGDLNDNGAVGADDLAILLGQWGGPGSGDLTNNGQVLSDDLAILLGAWGTCP
jgi:hypothetical protein